MIGFHACHPFVLSATLSVDIGICSLIVKASEGEEACGISRMLVSMRLSDLIVHLVSFGLGNNPSVLAQVLLTSHHPLVNLSQSSTGATWRRIQKLNLDITKLLAGKNLSGFGSRSLQ